MFNRDEILQEAINGTECTPEWVAQQTVKLYREYMEQGYSHDESLLRARREMYALAAEAMQIRRNRKELWKDRIAPWLVILGGIALVIGWWNLWE